LLGSCRGDTPLRSAFFRRSCELVLVELLELLPLLEEEEEDDEDEEVEDVVDDLRRAPSRVLGLEDRSESFLRSPDGLRFRSCLAAFNDFHFGDIEVLLAPPSFLGSHPLRSPSPDSLFFFAAFFGFP
jgi:hypothetical protein